MPLVPARRTATSPNAEQKRCFDKVLKPQTYKHCDREFLAQNNVGVCFDDRARRRMSDVLVSNASFTLYKAEDRGEDLNHEHQTQSR